MARSVASLELAALFLALAAVSAVRAAAGEEAPVLAPGWGELRFEPPAPGTYRLPPLGSAGDGAVLDSEGRPLSLHDLYGDGPVLLSFVYTSCSDVNGCPLATAVFHRLRTRLEEVPDVASRLRLVTLSFDPERDTPEQMERYGKALAGGGVDWRFLTTASDAELRPILAAYGQSVVREVGPEGDERGTLAHVLRVFLIDAAGRIRNVYSVSTLHADSLFADVRTLLLEEGGGAPATATTASDPDLRPGDDRRGYERPGYTSQSLGLDARRGQPADLLARARRAPLGLPPVPVPADNPLSPEKIALGRKLFFDRRLSLNGTFSCAMCHVPEQGFASNELATAVGIEGRTVRRNAPTIYDVAYLSRLFHDGRETRLEHQVWGPLLARNEMGNPSIGAVVEKLRSLPDYAGLFEAAFPDRGLAMESIGAALASYERTLVTGGSPFDRWRYAGEADAVSDEAREGFALFTGRAGCATCHRVGPQSAVFTDSDFHNTGVGYTASMRAPDDGGSQRIQVGPGQYIDVERELVAQVSEPPPGDLGLYEITQDPADRWRYRTPSLRNVALTPPYMHDGSLATLRDVVLFYDGGGVPNENLDPRIAPLGLAGGEVAALVAFLESLTGDVAPLVADAFAAPVGGVQ